MVVRGNPRKIFLDHVLIEGRKTPLSKRFASLRPFSYFIQQFGVEYTSVENAIFIIAFRTTFEKNRRGISPC